MDKLLTSSPFKLSTRNQQKLESRRFFMPCQSKPGMMQHKLTYFCWAPLSTSVKMRSNGNTSNINEVFIILIIPYLHDQTIMKYGRLSMHRTSSDEPKVKVNLASVAILQHESCELRQPQHVVSRRCLNFPINVINSCLYTL